ncbi:MAG: tripartite tricarboxylate transporter substrate binding protein, partial [Betaproteobacteria bacterium]|nr:tripartite tricarboxylate transporter substrate binding protein [Betaproteobacteria bacterium]
MLALSTSLQPARAQVPAPAQPAPAWPAKAIKLVVPYPPGGPLDQIARALAERMRESLNQPLIVENRAGAGGNIGADHVAKSQGDGYTLLIGAVATHAINPFLYARMPYDANRDFVPVGLIAVVPNVLVMTEETAQRLRVSSLGDVVAYARKYPGKLNYASAGVGSVPHLAGELFKLIAKVDVTHIPYKGSSPAITDLLGGQVSMFFDNMASAVPYVKAGRLRALAITTPKRSA